MGRTASREFAVHVAPYWTAPPSLQCVLRIGFRQQRDRDRQGTSKASGAYPALPLSFAEELDDDWRSTGRKRTDDAARYAI